MVERMTQRFVLALDLVDDADLIAAYEDWHRPGHTPQPIIRSIREAGIDNMEIFRAGNRMVMIIDANDSFSLTAKAHADAANPEVQSWEARMKQFQRPIAAAGATGSWLPMDRVFRLTDHA